MTIARSVQVAPFAHRPLRLFFDLSGHEYWFRRELEGMLEVMASAPSVDGVLANHIEDADCVLKFGGCPSLNGRLTECFRWEPTKHPREFVWEMSDLPSGTLPGFYASLPSYMYDRRRHRAFCLPIRCNEVIQPYELGEAKFLYGFFGAVSSGVRLKMMAILKKIAHPAEALLVTRDSIWNQMFDRTGLQAKQDYADNLRKCRFNLCPRGSVLAGAGSRLYETMQASRVPVLISDWITLPEGIDWESCSVRVPERQIARIPQILRGYTDRWPEMAVNARRVWEAHFRQEVQLGELARQSRALLDWNGDAKITTRLEASARITLGLLALAPRHYYSNALRLRSRWRKYLSRG